MISLGQALALRPAADLLWSGRGGWRSVADVQTAVLSRAAQLPEGCVALAFADDESLALALLAADGRCESVLLVPSSWDQQMVERYLPMAGIETLVTDRTELTSPVTIRLDPASDGRPALMRERRKDTAWIIPTSGTTGEPKLVEHRLATLARTVRTDASKGRELTWGLVYELARFSGLQVFLQAILGGSRLVFVERHLGIETIASTLVGGGCNALSATPTLWRRLLMSPTADRLPLKLATLGGEIADQPVLGLLAARYPQAKVLHIYASTEAGVGFSVTDGYAGFPARYLDQPPSGVELKVDSEGTLWLRPATASQRFLDAGRDLVSANGWINSGDQVRREGERFFFLGRANGAINVGGNKVYPEEVEDCIRAITGVRQVGVRARANPMVGSLVEALVVSEPAADRASLKTAIVKSCRASLPAYKVPAIITWVDDLAVSAAGKQLR